MTLIDEFKRRLEEIMMGPWEMREAKALKEGHETKSGGEKACENRRATRSHPKKVGEIKSYARETVRERDSLRRR